GLARHAQRAAPDAWSRPYASPRVERAARPRCADLAGGARGAGPVRKLQGLQARLPDRRRHGTDEGRISAPLDRSPRHAPEGQAGCLAAALRALGLALPLVAEPAR